jgi:CheY-like chemotaxis protein
MATILYVEDHPPARLLMQAIISEMTDHRLLVADSGAAAFTMLHDAKPDLYILDLDLPDGDGRVLAEQLIKVSPAPVILVSAYAEGVEEQTLASSIQFYLAKPLDPDVVAATIQHALA